MPYLDTAQEWLTQSTLLIKARPSTTRITTKYNISHPPSSSKHSHSSHKPRSPKAKGNSTSPSETTTPTTPAPEPPRGTLVLKTYCPTSGVTLKYSTNKAAEVSRLIQILGRLGRLMAGLPEEEDVVVADAGVGGGEGVATPVEEKGAGGAGVGASGKNIGGQAQGQQAQGGKGKKKKGKK